MAAAVNPDPAEIVASLPLSAIKKREDDGCIDTPLSHISPEDTTLILTDTSTDTQPSPTNVKLENSLEKDDAGQLSLRDLSVEFDLACNWIQDFAALDEEILALYARDGRATGLLTQLCALGVEDLPREAPNVAQGSCFGARPTPQLAHPPRLRETWGSLQQLQAQAKQLLGSEAVLKGNGLLINLSNAAKSSVNSKINELCKLTITLQTQLAAANRQISELKSDLEVSKPRFGDLEKRNAALQEQLNDQYSSTSQLLSQLKTGVTSTRDIMIEVHEQMKKTSSQQWQSSIEEALIDNHHTEFGVLQKDLGAGRSESKAGFARLDTCLGDVSSDLKQHIETQESDVSQLLSAVEALPQELTTFMERALERVDLRQRKQEEAARAAAAKCQSLRDLLLPRLQAASESEAVRVAKVLEGCRDGVPYNEAECQAFLAALRNESDANDAGILEDAHAAEVIVDMSDTKKAVARHISTFAAENQKALKAIKEMLLISAKTKLDDEFAEATKHVTGLLAGLSSDTARRRWSGELEKLRSIAERSVLSILKALAAEEPRYYAIIPEQVTRDLNSFRLLSTAEGKAALPRIAGYVEPSEAMRDQDNVAIHSALVEVWQARVTGVAENIDAQLSARERNEKEAAEARVASYSARSTYSSGSSCSSSHDYHRSSRSSSGIIWDKNGRAHDASTGRFTKVGKGEVTRRTGRKKG